MCTREKENKTNKNSRQSFLNKVVCLLNYPKKKFKPSPTFRKVSLRKVLGKSCLEQQPIRILKWTKYFRGHFIILNVGMFDNLFSYLLQNQKDKVKIFLKKHKYFRFNYAICKNISMGICVLLSTKLSESAQR